MTFFIKITAEFKANLEPVERFSNCSNKKKLLSAGIVLWSFIF
jgi:hypothetical protein